MSACPACRAALPEGARFCPACGTRLVLTGRPDAERKMVTTLFADLVGFTRMAEGADPEDVDRVLREFAEMATHAVEIHGGIVEKFIGDAVVAVFGVPTAHEDDAERAVHAALRINQDAPRVLAPDGSPVRVRTGVNTGEALARLSTDARSGEGFLAGDAVNTAARLQNAAPPGGILVGPTTYALTSRLFRFEELEPVQLKGKAESTPVWLVHAAVSRTGADRATDFSSAFVGRRGELKRLDALLGEVIRRRHTRMALVTGEPGIGKSRLLAEFYRQLDQRPVEVTWRQGRCLPYGEGIAFWPLGEIVKAQAGILETDDVEVAERKLVRVLPENLDKPWIQDRLRPLVGLKAPAATQEETFSAWTQFIAQLAARRPLILVVEDLHWADNAMLAFLRQLATEDLGVPILLIATARTHFLDDKPEFAATVGPEELISLPPLTEPQIGDLLAALLDDSATGDLLRTSIVERCGGNPLYVEELLRLLRERVLAGERWGEGADVVLPQSLQAVIAARIDALPPRQKDYLANAAVVGRRFWDGAVAALAGDGEALAEGLRRLAAAELIRDASTSTMDGQREFVFWHALTRDVAYGQLTREARADKHERLARWIEERTGGRAADQADVLAHHYVTALETRRELKDETRAAALVEPAVRCLNLASARALALDVAAAQQKASHAVALATAASVMRADALVVWGDSLQQSGRIGEARDAYDEATGVFVANGRKSQAAGSMVKLSYTLDLLGEERDDHMEEHALSLLEDEPPSPELLYVLNSCASKAVHDCHPERAIQLCDRIADVNEQLRLPESTLALEIRAMARTLLGKQQAVGDFERALDLADSRSLGHEACATGANFAESLVIFAGPAAALERLEKTTELARRRHDSFAESYCRVLAFTSLVWRGEWQTALADVRDLDATLARQSDLWDLNLLRATWALTLTLLGSPHEAQPLAVWAEESSRVTRSLLPGARAACLVSLAVVEHALGRHDETRRLLLECGSILRGARGHPDYITRLPHALRLALGLDEDEVARELAAGVPRGSAFATAVLLALDGLLAMREGDQRLASQMLAESAVDWGRLGVPYEAAHAHLGEAHALASAGETRRAAKATAHARRMFERLGAIPDVAATDVLLRSLRGSPDQQAPG